MALHTRSTATGALRALQATAALTVLVLLFQGLSIGQYLTGNEGAEEWHAAGAIATHVVAGLATIAAFLVYRANRAATLPLVLAAVVFVVSFAQAWFGSHGPMTIHVPLAMLLTAAAAWLLVWSFNPRMR